LIFYLLVLAFVTPCVAQKSPKDSPPPAELKMADFMLGEWSETEHEEVAGKRVEITFRLSISKALGDRYLLVKHFHNMPGEPDVEGMHMLTFDPEKKLWRAWWFLSTEATATELSGVFEGDKLVMESKPSQMPGMTGDQSFRSSWRKTAEKGLHFTLDFKQGDSWVKMIDRTYVKKY